MATKRETKPQTLPRGRHGLPRELIVENQRARLIGSMIETVADLGYGTATIADVIKRAKISRRTFYEYFANKEDCYRAAYETSLEFLRETISTAVEGKEWPGSVRVGLNALLEALAAHSDLAGFFLISPPSVGDDVAARHHDAMREMVQVLLARAPKQRGLPTDVYAEALAGGLSRLLSTKLSGGRGAEVPTLLPDLVELFLRPFVGSEEAVRVAGGG